MDNFRRAYLILIGEEEVDSATYEDALQTVVEVMKPSCPFCNHKLEVKKFVDCWEDHKGAIPGDINPDLYCPYCRVRWSAGVRDGDNIFDMEALRKQIEELSPLLFVETRDKKAILLADGFRRLRVAQITGLPEEKIPITVNGSHTTLAEARKKWQIKAPNGEVLPAMCVLCGKRPAAYDGYCQQCHDQLARVETSK